MREFGASAFWGFFNTIGRNDAFAQPPVTGRYWREAAACRLGFDLECDLDHCPGSSLGLKALPHRSPAAIHFGIAL